jgi:hypothetical protein
MNYQDHALFYNEAFPKRPPLAYGNGMVTGVWMIGACYKNPNPLYGAYPHGYLARVHAMFHNAYHVLHAFSGGLTGDAARDAWVGEDVCHCGSTAEQHTPLLGCPRFRSIYDLELVDMHGPEKGRYPTWQGDIMDFCALTENEGRFDLILADPPYSTKDAAKYDCKMPNRRDVTRALRRVCKRGGNLVWLDQVWPQHRKAEWKTWGTIGLVRSTNHRVRMVSIFEAV